MTAPGRPAPEVPAIDRRTGWLIVAMRVMAADGPPSAYSRLIAWAMFAWFDEDERRAFPTIDDIQRFTRIKQAWRVRKAWLVLLGWRPSSVVLPEYDDGDTPLPSWDVLTRETGLSRRTVKRVLDEIAAHGLTRIALDGGGDL